MPTMNPIIGQTPTPRGPIDYHVYPSIMAGSILDRFTCHAATDDGRIARAKPGQKFTQAICAGPANHFQTAGLQLLSRFSSGVPRV
jgi:hypothetical protein